MRLRVGTLGAVTLAAGLVCCAGCGDDDDGSGPDGGDPSGDAGSPDAGSSADAALPDAGGEEPDAGAPGTALVAEDDLVHQGSFEVPGDIHLGTSNAGFEYGGTALGYNPEGDSLFLTGHDWDQFSAEISIPALGGTATLLQPLTDALEGQGGDIGEGTAKTGGHLVYDGQLFISEYLYYDGPGTQSLSHFVRPLDLSTTGQVEGPFRVGPLGAGFYSGYFGSIPSAWQEALGGPVLNGNSCLSIISRTSYGPAVFAIDPADIGVAESAAPLVYYPADHPTLGEYGDEAPNAYFNGSSQVRGVVFPEGTASVLFFGRHGIGAFCYGEGTDDPALDGEPVPDEQDVIYCYDPADGSKGTHAFPYRPYVWAYDANDLASVHAGAAQPWEVRPYAVWGLAIPGVDEDASNSLGGAAYDAASGRIFISQMLAEGDRPLIHVFTVAER